MLRIFDTDPKDRQAVQLQQTCEMDHYYDSDSSRSGGAYGGGHVLSYAFGIERMMLE